ncbi:unnamed protein product [Spirodela intermedia]|uniref:Uncharacterized protein n=1 Tax=Spirodela intermedia TaxID=51605 RepID=A0A7I8K328_SPIIN|nr:unnamed protein product [Spirodela intermedia]
MGRMRSFLLAAALSATLFLLTAANDRTPAVYVFGDSSVDVGNNNYLPGNLGKVNFRPNGIDYPGGKPTGRFSNGYNVADFLAMKVGLKKSPPAYLSLTSDAQMHGVNFASGGSGILNATNFSVSLNKQIDYFERITHSQKTRLGDAATSLFLSQSLFVVSTGSNDFSVFLGNLQLLNGTQIHEIMGFLTQQFKNQLKMLYELGARKLVVFGTSQVGCAPLLRRTTPSGDCIEELNEVSRLFSNAVEVLLHDLASTSKGLSYTFVDSYRVMAPVLSNPSKYGFSEIKSACCGSGTLNAESACTPNATYCSSRLGHLFWDRTHLTEAAQRLIAEVAYHGGREFVRPMNIQQLYES